MSLWPNSGTRFRQRLLAWSVVFIVAILCVRLGFPSSIKFEPAPSRHSGTLTGESVSGGERTAPELSLDMPEHGPSPDRLTSSGPFQCDAIGLALSTPTDIPLARAPPVQS